MPDADLLVFNMSLSYYVRKAYRGMRLVYYRAAPLYSHVITSFKFYLNGVKFHNDFIGYGVPIIDINMEAEFSIGKGFRFNSGKYHAMGGRQQQCYFTAGKGAKITIGDNVGVTSVAIISRRKITIGNNVKIGINTVIYDSDFHSLDARIRNQIPESVEGVKPRSVTIMDGAFIGGHTTILKGVTIGKNSIIGAGSVVFHSVPDEQVWAGNPAVFIRENRYPLEA
jgi:acetyltransferase-like isoleucine patch superfamily enzyme